MLGFYEWRTNMLTTFLLMLLDLLSLICSESKDGKAIIKKWRGMMLKNHPDTGGSPYVAAKINEAKEIIMGEKVAKEGSEEEDSQSAGGEGEEDEGAIARKEMAADRREYHAGIFTEDNEVLGDAATAPETSNAEQYDHPAQPYYNWTKIADPTPVQRKASPTTTFFIKESTFHRKATRTNPNFLPIDDPSIWPKEHWRDQYVKDLERMEQIKKYRARQRVTFEEDVYTPGTDRGADWGFGRFYDGTGQPIRTKPGEEMDDLTHAEIEIAHLRSGQAEELIRKDALERVAYMARQQAQRRENIKRAKKVKEEDRF